MLTFTACVSKETKVEGIKEIFNDYSSDNNPSCASWEYTSVINKFMDAILY